MLLALLLIAARIGSQVLQHSRRLLGVSAQLLGSCVLCLPLLATPTVAAKTHWQGGNPFSPTDHAPVQQTQRASNTEKPSVVALAALPALEQKVYRLIHQGGPFPYEKDGSVFGNRERLLPAKKRGFYREYTVAPPRARSRGSRRIVCGGPKRNPQVCYHTADHYASFQKIIP